jgi:hypothetical protein
LQIFAPCKQIKLIKYLFDFATEFPEENPTIDDIKQYYGAGEVFETNCTSNSSIPPAKLEWWINDMPMYNAEYTIKYSTIVDPVTNRETSILGLRLPLTNEHFYRGRVKVSEKKFSHIAKCFQFILHPCIFSSMERLELDG